MNKPITEKDFENSVYQFMVLNSERQEPDNDSYSKRAGTHCFELAKKMAIDFATFISEHELDFQPASKGVFIGLDMKYYTSSHLFELYQQQKQ